VWTTTLPSKSSGPKHTFSPCFRTPLLQALIALLELPEDDSVPDDEHFVEIEDTPGYQAAFSQLVFAGKHDSDPCGDVADVKINLAHKLHTLSTKVPGQVRPTLVLDKHSIPHTCSRLVYNMNVAEWFGSSIFFK
jgi:hypothetical protein